MTVALIGVATALIGIVSLFVRQRPRMRELKLEGESALATRLEARIVKLENDLEVEREARRKMQETYDARIMLMSAEHEQEKASQRHQIANLDQCLLAFTMLLRNVDDPIVKTAVEEIQKMRDRQKANETVEKVNVHRTRIETAVSAQTNREE